MNFFEQLVIPPTAEHNTLLNIVQAVSFLLFYPFSSMIAGSLLFSLYYDYKGRKSKNKNYIDIGKDFILKLPINKNAGYSLVLLPALSIAIIVSQFLYSAKVISLSVVFISLVIYLISLIYNFKYRSSTEIENILENNEDEKIKAYSQKIYGGKMRFAKTALFLFLLATFLFIGSITIAGNMSEWDSVNNIIQLLLNGSVWLNFLFFLIFSVSFTSVLALFFMFNWNGGVKFTSEDYKNFVKNKTSNIALFSGALLIVFVFISSVILPKQAISSGVLFFSGLALIFLLFVCNFVYAIIRNSEMKYSSYAFSFFIIALAFIVIKNQIAFSNAIQTHLVIVNNTAQSIANEKQPKSNKVSEISGEEIYKNRCSACHNFDVKVVGPPYKETVPKYNGDEKKLAQFIYNPSKVNPDYPPMPNQGIKMKEAEAVAKYLIEQLKKK